MSVPNSFATASGTIPLSQLDSNFAYYDAAYQIAASTMEINYTLRLEDVTDNTKKAEFVISGITTATTRQFTFPNSSGTFALIGLAQTWTATQTFNAAITSGNFAYTWAGTTTNYSINAGQSSGTIVVGGVAGTGAITVGQSTGAQTLNLGTGATLTATTKTVNIGTAGVSGSTTNINLGSAVAGSVSSHNVYGNLFLQNGSCVRYAPTPAAITTTATLTNANIQAQLINTTGTTYTVTMPLGTTLDTLVAWPAVDLGYDFTVINTASGIITMAANTGVTTLGALTIAAASSAQFRIRRTSASNYVLYRLT